MIFRAYSCTTKKAEDYNSEKYTVLSTDFSFSLKAKDFPTTDFSSLTKFLSKETHKKKVLLLNSARVYTKFKKEIENSDIHTVILKDTFHRLLRLDIYPDDLKPYGNGFWFNTNSTYTGF